MTLPTSARPLAAAAAGLLLLAGCGDDGSGADDASVEDVTENPGLDFGPLGEVIEDGDQLVGQEVTVSGEVTAQINERVFHIASEPGTNGLLIVSDEPIVDQLGSDTVVEVTGTLREVAPSTFEAEFGLPYDEGYDSFGARHAILATDVEIVGQVDDEIDGAEDRQGREIEQDDQIGDFGRDDDVGNSGS